MHAYRNKVGGVVGVYNSLLKLWVVILHKAQEWLACICTCSTPEATYIII